MLQLFPHCECRELSISTLFFWTDCNDPFPRKKQANHLEKDIAIKSLWRFRAKSQGTAPYQEKLWEKGTGWHFESGQETQIHNPTHKYEYIGFLLQKQLFLCDFSHLLIPLQYEQELSYLQRSHTIFQFNQSVLLKHLAEQQLWPSGLSCGNSRVYIRIYILQGIHTLCSPCFSNDGCANTNIRC